MTWRKYHDALGPPDRPVAIEKQQYNSPLDAVVTFGQFKGQKLRVILKSKEGVDWARWCANNARSPKWREVFRAALKEARL